MFETHISSRFDNTPSQLQRCPTRQFVFGFWHAKFVVVSQVRHQKETPCFGVQPAFFPSMDDFLGFPVHVPHCRLPSGSPAQMTGPNSGTRRATRSTGGTRVGPGTVREVA